MLHTHTQPDSDQRAALAAEEIQRREAENLSSHVKTYTAGYMGDLMIYADLNELPTDKIRFGRIERFLGEKAETREPMCWREGCRRNAITWVREVLFDLAEEGAPQRKASVDSSHLTGPVPGFCGFCINSWDGPRLLAQKVYSIQEPMAWGFRPNRWFVILTDGLPIGGDCIELEAPPQPIVREEVIHA